MSASAFRDRWSRVMFFKFRRRVQFETLKNITFDHISITSDFTIFIYNILNKIIKKEENETVRFLWTRNSVMAPKLLTFHLSRNFGNCDKKKKKQA